jgi:hypothetical protein
MSNRSEHDFSDLIDYEYLNSDPSVHTYLYELSHLDGQPLDVLAEPLDAHQYFILQASQDLENGASCWEQSHQTGRDCSTLQLSTSFSTDFGMDALNQARNTTFSRVQKEVGQEGVGVLHKDGVRLLANLCCYVQQVEYHPSLDLKYQTGDDVMVR